MSEFEFDVVRSIDFKHQAGYALSKLPTIGHEDIALDDEESFLNDSRRTVNQRVSACATHESSF